MLKNQSSFDGSTLGGLLMTRDNKKLFLSRHQILTCSHFRRETFTYHSNFNSVLCTAENHKESGVIARREHLCQTSKTSLPSDLVIAM